MKNILLTGASGFVGGELIQRLLRQFPDSEIQLLLRPKGNQTARQRFDQLLAKWAMEPGFRQREFASRLRLLEGNLEAPKLGISGQGYWELAGRINQIFHVAASVNLFGEYQQLRRTNLDGTRCLLELAAAAPGLERFHYISTAYVAGQRQGIIREEELNMGQSFNNAYERVKWEAERLAEAAKCKLPLTIYRPSIIAGDSRTGYTACFNVIYEPLLMLFRGKLPFIPETSRPCLDVVPVDFVCDAIATLAALPLSTLGKTFHLSAGAGKAVSSLDLAHWGALAFERRSGQACSMPPTILPSLALAIACAGKFLSAGNAARMRRFEKMTSYARYAGQEKTFDTVRASDLLEPKGIRAPALSNYFEVLMDFAFRQNFGSKTPLVPAGDKRFFEENQTKNISYATQS